MPLQVIDMKELPLICSLYVERSTYKKEKEMKSTCS